MARRSGNYKQGYFSSIANALAGVNAWLALVDTDVGTATQVDLNIGINVNAENAGGDLFTHKFTATLSAATETLMNAQLAHLMTDGITPLIVDSNFATINTVDVTASVSMSN